MNGMPRTPSQKSIDVWRSAPTIVMWWTPWLWIFRTRASLDRRPSFQDPYLVLRPSLRLMPMVSPMRSRIAAAIAGVVMVVALAAGPAYASKGAYFGTAVEIAPGENSYDALTSLERIVGRRFHILRLYRSLNDTTFSGAGPEAMHARREPMYLNVSSAIGRRCVSWRAVAAGKYNRYLKSI